MKKIALLVILAAALTFTAQGCKQRDELNLFYPMSPGSKWTYKTTITERDFSQNSTLGDAQTPDEVKLSEEKSSKELTTDVSADGFEILKGVKSSVMSYGVNSYSDRFRKEYYICEKGDVKLVQTALQDKYTAVVPPMMILPGEDNAVKDWTWSGETGFGKANAYFKITKSDIINAGTNYEHKVSTRVDSIIILIDGSLSIQESKWYAMGIGLIKSSTKIIETDKREININSEIAEYQMSESQR